MRSPLLVYLFIACFFIGKNGRAQSIIPRFEQLNVNNGLPHSSVYCIAQDQKGFMWFGTADGLCRYDGSEVKTFRYYPKKETETANNTIRGKLFADQKGNIWYSNNGGIYKWDVITEKIIVVKPFSANQFENVDFKTVALDKNGTLWLFNVIYGVFEFNIFNNSLKYYPLPKTTNRATFNYAYSIADENENIWIRIVSNNDPYFVFDKKTHLYHTAFAKEPPPALIFDKEQLIMAYDNKLVYKNLHTNKTKTIFKTKNGSRFSFSIFEGVKDNYNRFWMTTKGSGLIYYDEKRDLFVEFRHQNSKLKSLPFDITTCLFIDSNENLWIGTDGGGIAKLDLKQPKFNIYPLSDGDYPAVSDYFTKCFFEDEKGRIWFGSHTNGLNILDKETNTLTNYQHEKNKRLSLPANTVGSIIKDKDGKMWIGSSGGISLFNEEKKTFNTLKFQLVPKPTFTTTNYIYKMIVLKNGSLLAGTTYGLIAVTKTKNNTYTAGYFNDNPYSHSTMIDVLEIPDGKIYAIHPNIGLYTFEPQKKGYLMSTVALRGIDLRSIRLDEQDHEWLWIGTSKGLLHYHPKTQKYRLFNESQGLLNNYVYGSLEDQNGNIWLSTNGGLSYFNTRTERFENYTYQHGLQSNEFNTQSFYKSARGNLYFGGIKGFNWFNPSTLSSIVRIPKVAVTKIEISDKVFEKDSSFLATKKITVNYDNNDFDFQFAALDFTKPEANQISYILEGWDKKWVTTSAKSVRYTNILPGKYTFRLKASNVDGAWSKIETIEILIKAPFWKKSWFEAMVMLFFVGLMMILAKKAADAKAKKQLRALEQQIAIDVERNRISADMHDEIGSGITHIALLSEFLQHQNKNAGELKQDVNTIAVSARKLVQTMSEIIWSLNPQNETLENLLAYIREQSQQYFDPFVVKLTIDFPDKVPFLKLSNMERRNLYLVTKELLSNCMKHANATEVILSLQVTETEFCFTVTDDGKGMGEKKLRQNGNGIQNLKKRMIDIRGTIDWLPELIGTQVRYCFPIN